MNMNHGGLNLHNVTLAATAGSAAQHIKYGPPQVAFSGRSNVGKSSLVNCLLGRKKLARVSGEPGKTITVNYYLVDKSLYLVDLPGYGFARRPKQDQARWSAVTQAYFAANSSLRLVLQLIDARIGATDDDRMMLDYMNANGIPYVIVATKCDKLTRAQLDQTAKKLLDEPLLRPGTGIIFFSSLKGTGRDELWQLMLCSIAEQ